jgi:hypothetical protein
VDKEHEVHVTEALHDLDRFTATRTELTIFE